MGPLPLSFWLRIGPIIHISMIPAESESYFENHWYMGVLPIKPYFSYSSIYQYHWCTAYRKTHNTDIYYSFHSFKIPFSFYFHWTLWMAESRKRNMISSSKPHSLLSGRKHLLTVKDSLQIKTKADQSKWCQMKMQESQDSGEILAWERCEQATTIFIPGEKDFVLNPNNRK